MDRSATLAPAVAARTASSSRDSSALISEGADRPSLERACCESALRPLSFKPTSRAISVAKRLLPG
jgi:hypothetical protein